MKLGWRPVAVVLVTAALVTCTNRARGTTPSLPGPDPNGKIHITVGDSGFSPPAIRAPAGKPLTLVFDRKTANPSGDRVVIPAFNISKKLPRDVPVAITFTPKTKGHIAFMGGMTLLAGTLVVQ